MFWLIPSFPYYKHCCNKHSCAIENTWKYNTINSVFLKQKPHMCCSSRVTSSQERVISALSASHWCCEVHLRKCVRKFLTNFTVCGVVVILWSYSFTTTLQSKHGGYVLKAHGPDNLRDRKNWRLTFRLLYIYFSLAQQRMVCKKSSLPV